MPRSTFPNLVLALSAVLALTALGLFVTRSGYFNRPHPVEQPESAVAAPAPVPVPTPAAPKPAAIPEIPPPLPPAPAATTPSSRKPTVAEANPEVLVGKITSALEAGDFNAVARLADASACDEKTLAQLKALASQHPLKFIPTGPREIGELELNALTRWALAIDGAEPGRHQIFLDLRHQDGKWSVEKLTLPPRPGEPIPAAVFADPLGIADSFLQAVLKQDFESACHFIDPMTVSAAKIAALCILFEEGKFELRHAKPLRAMLLRADTAGYLANVQTADGTQTAQFSLTLRHPPAPSNWIIAEINLDQLLADNASPVAGGDIYYCPLVKSPRGGDTLALYFEFDEDQANPRTRRQLEIVSQILLADPARKITLSGHTDALGTAAYNNGLSARRATTVRDFLAAAGVPATQIVTVAKGASQPRRPNVTETGADDPAGRRANRRTEIYLDF